jgi:DNA-3-methyladenine glycosylase II
VIKIPSRKLKSAGLSRQKISYLKNIAKAFKNKSFDVRKLKKMNDDEVINYITKLKGLGVWSSQMLMIFNLNRPDVFPVKDVGLLRAISKNYRKTSYPPSKKFLDKISKLHAGYRSVFTWYMWRSIDPTDVTY